MKLPPLTSIRAFEAVARLSSVKRAAEELHVTPAAVSYQLKVLEEDLGVMLFVRGNRSITLSDTGKQAIDDVSAGFRLLERGISRARRQRDQNILVVSAGPALSVKWLAPHLHEFTRLNPHIDARVSANTRYSDFFYDGVDIAVRFGNPQTDGLAVTHLLHEWVVPMCSPNLELPDDFQGALERGEIPLIHDDAINFAASEPNWPHWFKRQKLDPAHATRGIRFNQADHALQAAIDANGIVLGRYGLAIADLLSGRLRIPFGPALDTRLDFYIVTPLEFHERGTVRAFVDWLNGLFQSSDEKARRFLDNHIQHMTDPTG